MADSGNVAEFYRGKSVLITGGTGFIGKVLIEKLLSSCPGIESIYLLVRSSRDGKPPEQRVQDEIIKSRIFSLRKFSYDFEKLRPVPGDMCKPRLGLSQPDYQTLCQNVDLVFHSAATVRFHGPLKKYIHQNVFSTESVMKLGRDMAKLKCIVYVSTAYANCDRTEVEEKVYPLMDDIQPLIDRIIREDSDKTPGVGDPALMGRPNSYTISKAIAETLVQQKYSDLPVVICRPSIVTHALAEPAPGWCDSFNGVAGTLLLGGLGIARTMEIHCDFTADLIPVDFVANSLAVIGYHYSEKLCAAAPGRPVPVVHITVGALNPVTWGQILDYGRQAAIDKPSVKMIRPVAQNPVSAKGVLGKVQHLLTVLFSHILFAHIFDGVLLLSGNKRVMVDVTKKMHRAFEVLEHFTNHQWLFRNDTYQAIYRGLSGADKKCFASDVTEIDWVSYSDSLYMGCRRYLLGEDDSTIEQGRRRQRTLTWAYGALNTFLWLSLAASVAYLVAGLILSTTLSRA